MARLTPQDIREQEFKQSALGYNRDQVNEFLGELAEELETFIQESKQVHAENNEARLALKTYMNVEDSLKETLLLAQKTGQDTIRSAQKEAAAIITKAETEKAALLFTAKENLASVQNDILELRAKRDAMVIKLRSVLHTNLELLDSEFSDPADIHSQTKETNPPNERIVDFSKSDLMVEDLTEEEETRQDDDAEDFSIL